MTTYNLTTVIGTPEITITQQPTWGASSYLASDTTATFNTGTATPGTATASVQSATYERVDGADVDLSGLISGTNVTISGLVGYGDLRLTIKWTNAGESAFANQISAAFQEQSVVATAAIPNRSWTVDAPITGINLNDKFLPSTGLTISLGSGSDPLPTGVTLSGGILSGTPTDGAGFTLNLIFEATDGTTIAQQTTAAVVSAPGAETLTLTQSQTESDGIGGSLFYAEVIGASENDPYFDWDFVWTFSDPGDYSRMATDMPWGRSKNIAYGPQCCHVFAPTVADFGGANFLDYTVTCTARGPGMTEAQGITDTLTFRVNNPDVVYAGAQTLIVSNTSDFTGKPDAANLEYTSLDAARNFVNGTSTKYRIMLRCGDTFTSPTDWDGLFENDHLYITYIGDPDVDGYPFITGVNGFKTRCAFTAVNGLKIYGDYHPATTPPDGASPQSKGLELAGKDSRFGGNAYATVWDVESGGHQHSIEVSGNRDDTYIGNVYLTQWYDYGIYCGRYQSRFGLAGATVKQSVDARNGNGTGKYASSYPNHGPIRLSNEDGPVAFSLIDFASFNSWASGVDDYAIQPTTRVGNGGEGFQQPVVIDRFRSCGGKLSISRTNQYDTKPNPKRTLIDRFDHLVWIKGAGNAMEVDFPGVHFRNGIIRREHYDDVDWRGSNLVISVPPHDNSTADVNKDIWEEYLTNIDLYETSFYNILLVDVSTSTDGSIYDVFSFNTNNDYTAGYTNDYSNIFTSAQLAFHAPAYGLDQSPLDTTTLAYAPLPIGTHKYTEGLDATYAVSNTPMATFIPQTGSPMLNAAEATGRITLRDFYGYWVGDVPRAQRSLGPFEPSKYP